LAGFLYDLIRYFDNLVVELTVYGLPCWQQSGDVVFRFHFFRFTIRSQKN